MDNFWPHLKQKSQTDQKRRLKWLACALELIQKSKIPPAFEHKNCIKQEILYRFIGEYEKQYFVVQIKEDLKRKQKFLMSVFGYDLREK